MKKFIFIIFIIVLIVGAAVLFNKRKQSIKNTPLPTPVTYTVATTSSKQQKIIQTRLFLSQLTARDVAILSPKQSGQIKQILVSENQQVKKGDILARIDDREIISNIQALNSTLKAQAQDKDYTYRLYERKKNIYKSGGVSQDSLESSKMQYFQKKADLETTRQKIISAKAQLSYLIITAPFDGIIGTIYLREGSLATPGQPLISLNSLDQKLVFSFVPDHTNIIVGQNVMYKNTNKKNIFNQSIANQSSANQSSANQSSTNQSRVGQNKIVGRISKLYSDAKNGLSVAEVFLYEPFAKPNNSYLTISVVTFSGTGCTVPINAFLHKKNKTQILLYENGHFKPVSVTITAQNNEYAIVSPCPSFPVAIGTEAQLSQLPTYGKILIQQGE